MGLKLSLRTTSMGGTATDGGRRFREQLAAGGTPHPARPPTWAAPPGRAPAASPHIVGLVNVQQPAPGSRQLFDLPPQPLDLDRHRSVRHQPSDLAQPSPDVSGQRFGGCDRHGAPHPRSHCGPAVTTRGCPAWWIVERPRRVVVTMPQKSPDASAEPGGSGWVPISLRRASGVDGPGHLAVRFIEPHVLVGPGSGQAEALPIGLTDGDVSLPGAFDLPPEG